jgi:hypothetical protein
MSRSEFIQDFLSNWDSNPDVRNVTPQQLSKFLDSGLTEYSSFRPRLNVAGTAEVVRGSKVIVLPADIIPALTDKCQFYRLIFDNSEIVYTRRASFDFTYPSTRSLEINKPEQLPAINYEMRNVIVDEVEQSRYCLILSSAPISNRSQEFNYAAVHLVENATDESSARNTLDSFGKSKVITYMEWQLYLYLSRRSANIIAGPKAKNNIWQNYESLASSKENAFYRGLRKVAI